MSRAWMTAAVLALAGCAGPAEDTSTLTVFAAASLTRPFTDLAAQYERDNPGVDVVLNLAGSSDLVAQLEQGASADVLATADAVTMTRAAQSLPLSPRRFATNTMQIVVPADNPGGVTGLADLQDPGVRTVVCAPQVPCGAATAQVARNAGIDIPAVSEESAVTDVLGKVSSGEADAGIVYLSDVLTAGDAVRGIAIPASVNAVNEYLISPLGEAGQPFVDLVLGPDGQAALSATGFGPR